jgi:MFS family permease
LLFVVNIPSLVSRVDEAIFPLTSRRASIVMSGVIVALLSLVIFSVRQNILTYDNTLETLYFVLTVVVAWGIGSWFLLGYVKKATTTSGTRRGTFVSALHLAVVATQFSMLAVMLFVIFDRSTEYVMPYVNGITSGFAILIMAAFAFKILRWYRKNSRKLIILLYFFTAASIAVMLASDLAAKFMITYTVTESAPGEVSREEFLYRNFEGGQHIKNDIEPDFTVSYIVPAAILPVFAFINNYPGLASLLLRWGATSYTLNIYNRERKKMNGVIFMVLITLPIAIFVLGQSPSLLGITPEPWTRPLFRGGNIAIGVLFGLAFLAMARKGSAVSDYLTVSAVGIMILTIAFGITNMQQTFGIAGHSLVLLSSYMFAVGLYYCAVSVSHDAALRKEIHRSAHGASSDLLESTGTAEMYEELEERVLSMSKQQKARLLSETGVRPSLEEGDIKQYLDKVVLPEVLKEKKVSEA